MTSAEGDWLTINEACEFLRVTRATIYRWARQGKLRVFRLGDRASRVKRSDLDKLLRPRWNDPWAARSESSFAEDWDNELDAVYDNWRELYGVRSR